LGRKALRVVPANEGVDRLGTVNSTKETAMSDFVHYPLGILSTGDVVRVNLEERANVLLLDAANFRRYRNEQDHTYYGGEALKSPCFLKVPHSGEWHVALDLGGASGTIHSSVDVRSAAA
jgi:hypothetical protein